MPAGKSLIVCHMVDAADLSDSDDSEASAESEGGTIDWDIPLKLPRSVLLAARQARDAEVAASAAVRTGTLNPKLMHLYPDGFASL